MLSLYAKAALYSPADSSFLDTLPLLPKSESYRSIKLNIENINRYNKLVSWDNSVGSLLHPNYIQVLSLPMQLEMMAKPPFPFKAMGLVHIANSIDVNCLPLAYGNIDISAYFGNLYRHRRGVVFEIVTKAEQTGNECVTAVSYYLARLNADALSNVEQKLSLFDDSLLISINENDEFSDLSPLRFSNDAGREYAKVSGDYNPIHLCSLTASIFGFKHAIAHGMYSKALVFSKLYYLNRVTLSKGEFSLNTVFKAPISLPKTTWLQQNTGSGFCLSSKKDNKTRQHMLGEIIYN